MTAKTTFEWIQFQGCGYLLSRRHFPQILKWFFTSFVRLVILFESDVLCLGQNEMKILRTTRRAVVRAGCGV